MGPIKRESPLEVEPCRILPSASGLYNDNKQLEVSKSGISNLFGGLDGSRVARCQWRLDFASVQMQSTLRTLRSKFKICFHVSSSVFVCNIMRKLATVKPVVLVSQLLSARQHFTATKTFPNLTASWPPTKEHFFSPQEVASNLCRVGLWWIFSDESLCKTIILLKKKENE